jgi:hypothetical protein
MCVRRGHNIKSAAGDEHDFEVERYRVITCRGLAAHFAHGDLSLVRAAEPSRYCVTVSVNICVCVGAPVAVAVTVTL